MQYVWNIIIVIAVTFLNANVIKNMLGKVSFRESKIFGEKVAKNLIVKPIIGTKYQLGLDKKKKKKKKAGKKS